MDQAAPADRSEVFNTSRRSNEKAEHSGTTRKHRQPQPPGRAARLSSAAVVRQIGLLGPPNSEFRRLLIAVLHEWCSASSLDLLDVLKPSERSASAASSNSSTHPHPRPLFDLLIAPLHASSPPSCGPPRNPTPTPSPASRCTTTGRYSSSSARCRYAPSPSRPARRLRGWRWTSHVLEFARGLGARGIVNKGCVGCKEGSVHVFDA